MRPLKVRNIVLEQGRPKIAVPITGKTHQDIMKQVKEAVKGPCDILEWRADYYFAERENSKEKLDENDAQMELIRILDDIDYKAGGCPVIFTLRSVGEGGKVNISREAAYDLATLAAQSKLIDFIDMQLFDDDDTFDGIQVKKQVERIHEFGVKVIMSFHEFDRMLKDQEITNVVSTMRKMGADIPKIACKASTLAEANEMQHVASVLTADEQGPVIMIAMGEPGKVTRITGGASGSCISFAKGKESTAPGQIDAHTLSKYLDKYYDNGSF